MSPFRTTCVFSPRGDSSFGPPRFVAGYGLGRTVRLVMLVCAPLGAIERRLDHIVTETTNHIEEAANAYLASE